jgi:hypothetical protein
MGDAEDKPAQRRLIATEPLDPPENLDEDLAGQVLGFGDSAASQVADHARAVPPPHLGERPGLTSSHRRDEIVVVRRVPTHIEK